MDTGQLSLLQKTLDDIRHENGIEYWYAKELFPLLGYTTWTQFEEVINRAILACRNSGSDVEENFSNIQRPAVGSQTGELMQDIRLTRYACYLIAINGDPGKQEIAFAQAYFVTQTRQIEVLLQRMSEMERLDTRKKLSLTEKEFSSLLYHRGVDGNGFGIIRSAGDEALFGGYDTEAMKTRLGVKKGRPLPDFLPNVTLKAKDLATEMTAENTRTKGLSGMHPIKDEHVNNNRNVRDALKKSNILPESLPPAEDIRKIKSRHERDKRELEKKQRLVLQAAKKKHKKEEG